MKARPILFSAPMVRALLDDRKTQTRRIVKPQPDLTLAYSAGQVTRFDLIGTDVRTGCQEWGARDGASPINVFPDGPGCAIDTIRCPYGVPGDLLIVRETWKPHSLYAAMKPRDMPQTKVFYRADDTYAPSNTPWKPGIHMPRWASRLTLEITDVRVERLQAISEADAIAEGLYKSFPDDEDRAWFDAHYEDEARKPTPEEWAQFEEGVWMVPGVPQGWGMTKAERRRDTWGPTPQFCYRLLWEHINGPDSWAANPWVWAVSFAVHRANVDQLLADRGRAA